MKEKLEKIIKFSLDQGKEWEEIEQIIYKKSIVLGISEEESKLILENNKPVPEEELKLKEEEILEEKNFKIEKNIEKGLGLYKSLILLQFKILGWMISFGKLVKTRDVIDEWNKINFLLKKK